MKIKNPTLGSDIEFFIKTVTGEPFPAIGIVGGSKENPKPLGQKYFIQEDNVAVEFNIPVAKSPNQFYSFVQKGFHKCVQALPPTFQPFVAASCEFKPQLLANPQAREFGCEPDINAYTRKVNPRPRAKNENLRSCGGHVHIGWDNPDMETRFELIKACDVFVSLPSIWEDTDKKRRELYGKAGAMRIKPYGVEHRVLSNYWINYGHQTEAVAERYWQAIEFINRGLVVDAKDEEQIIEAINSSNAKLAKTLNNKYYALCYAA